MHKLPSIKQTVQYLHTAAGHPTEDTWLKAIRKGNYNSWPLIDTKTGPKYFPESEETQFGHMRGQRQGVQSTCTTHPTVADTPNKLLEKKNDIFIYIYELNENDRLTGTLYADQTGDFPHVSSHGNRSIMLLHHIDSNSMWVESLKNQKEPTLIAAQMCALEQMRRQGIVPKHQILANQCHGLMKQAIKKTTLSDGSISKMTYELIPPEEHQRNMAKKSIQTIKDHFVGVLSGCAKTMPMHLWCQLLPQVEWQLLLLRQS